MAIILSNFQILNKTTFSLFLLFLKRKIFVNEQPKHIGDELNGAQLRRAARRVYLPALADFHLTMLYNVIAIHLKL